MSGVPLPGDPPDLDLEIDLLLEAIYRKYSYDFRHHARASIRRRVLAALASFGLDRVSLLQDHILRDAEAFTGLLRQLARVTFSDHCLATDQVFAEVHLVSCRNVLIYFDRELQDRALGLFRDSLVPRGFLGLGSRETLRVSRHADAFDEVARDERIYRRIA